MPVIVTVLESPADTIGCMANHRLSQRAERGAPISGAWRREILGTEAGKGVKESGGSGSRGVGDRQKGRERVGERRRKSKGGKGCCDGERADRETKAPYGDCGRVSAGCGDKEQESRAIVGARADGQRSRAVTAQPYQWLAIARQSPPSSSRIPAR